MPRGTFCTVTTLGVSYSKNPEKQPELVLPPSAVEAGEVTEGAVAMTSRRVLRLQNLSWPPLLRLVNIIDGSKHSEEYIDGIYAKSQAQVETTIFQLRSANFYVNMDEAYKHIHYSDNGDAHYISYSIVDKETFLGDLLLLQQFVKLV